MSYDHRSALTARTWYDDTAIASDIVVPDQVSDQIFDVAIVGGGLAGTSLLLALSQAGLRTILVEKDTLGAGASGRNGGFCTEGWAASFDEMRRTVGTSTATALAKVAQDGIDWMRTRMQRPAYASSMAVNGELNVSMSGAPPATVPSENRLLYRDDLREIFSTRRYRFGCYAPGGLHFHPLNFLRQLAHDAQEAGGQILEQTQILEIQRPAHGFSLTCTGRAKAITARKVVIATGGYFGPEFRYIKNRLLQIRTYIGVTSKMPDLLDTHIKCDWAIADTRRAGNYYRRLCDGRLLWGTAITAFGTFDTGKVRRLISSDIAAVYPNMWQDMQASGATIDYCWAGNMAYAPHFLPYVGQVEPDLYTLTGFGGHGMNTAPAAAHILADLIVENHDDAGPFDAIPKRRTFGHAGRVVAELNYRLRQYTDHRAELKSQNTA